MSFPAPNIKFPSPSPPANFWQVPYLLKKWPHNFAHLSELIIDAEVSEMSSLKLEVLPYFLDVKFPFYS